MHPDIELRLGASCQDEGRGAQRLQPYPISERALTRFCRETAPPGLQKRRVVRTRRCIFVRTSPPKAPLGDVENRRKIAPRESGLTRVGRQS